MDFSTPFLLASLFWGSVGSGYWIYGKKQQSMTAMIGGIVMIALSCFLSPLWMTVACVAVAAGVYYRIKQGYD